MNDPNGSFATPEGTARFAARHTAGMAADHFRAWPVGAPPGERLTLSSLGLGTYTGTADDATDRLYTAAVTESVRRGINLFDCAINYRHMRSERALGRGLRELFDTGEASRDEIVYMTKAGFIPFDREAPEDPAAYLRKTYIEPGLLEPGDIAGGCHAIAPRFLSNQLERSLANLGVKAVDVFFLHNIEQQLEAVSREEFAIRIKAAFRCLEEACAQGKIGLYGVATWGGFRVDATEKEHLELEELFQIAQSIGGDKHRFRVAQLPYNLGMLEALVRPTQTVQGKSVPFLVAAEAFGMLTVTSVPMLQTQILGHIPEAFIEGMPGLVSDAQRAIQFVRSTPGVTAPLIGMKRSEHVRENCAVGERSPLSVSEFRKLVGG